MLTEKKKKKQRIKIFCFYGFGFGFGILENAFIFILCMKIKRFCDSYYFNVFCFRVYEYTLFQCEKKLARIEFFDLRKVNQEPFL